MSSYVGQTRSCSLARVGWKVRQFWCSGEENFGPLISPSSLLPLLLPPAEQIHQQTESLSDREGSASQKSAPIITYCLPIRKHSADLLKSVDMGTSFFGNSNHNSNESVVTTVDTTYTGERGAHSLSPLSSERREKEEDLTKFSGWQKRRREKNFLQKEEGAFFLSFFLSSKVPTTLHYTVQYRTNHPFLLPPSFPQMKQALKEEGKKKKRRKS